MSQKYFRDMGNYERLLILLSAAERAKEEFDDGKITENQISERISLNLNITDYQPAYAALAI
ncbi:hypothetical protein [Providencia sp.]|uniref:hypothetical protein n=1 Tax=Providencia sp. TaxID=589 RepID=UPI000E80FF26|nr:hypothetical protein [Providencia sp.]MBP6080586.1 hypothetical protein [Providencia sp.]HBO22812.1 hypothetical protein [Providencia sp.]